MELKFSDTFNFLQRQMVLIRDIKPEYKPVLFEKKEEAAVTLAKNVKVFLLDKQFSTSLAKLPHPLLSHRPAECRNYVSAAAKECSTDGRTLQRAQESATQDFANYLVSVIDAKNPEEGFIILLSTVYQQWKQIEDAQSKYNFLLIIASALHSNLALRAVAEQRDGWENAYRSARVRHDIHDFNSQGLSGIFKTFNGIMLGVAAAITAWNRQIPDTGSGFFKLLIAGNFLICSLLVANKYQARSMRPS
jgi:hypothetical protein